MRAHLFLLISACAAVMVGAAALNFSVDSESNFALRGQDGQHVVERYVAKLRESKSGLVMIEQDRLVKAELARQSTDDCYVIGSSHVFQFDAMTVPAIFERCHGVTNLSVSAGGVEDFVALAGILAMRADHLRLYVEISPWSLRPNPSTIWTEYEDAYDRGRATLGLGERTFKLPRALDEWEGLFRADYAIMNMKFVADHEFRGRAEKAARVFAGVPSDEAKDDEVVNLPDGRLSYPAAMLQSVPPDPALVGDGGFNMADPALDPTTILEMERVVRILIDRGHKITFVMTPYHPSVVACRTPSVCRTLQTVENFARQAALRWKVPLIGSFDPRPFGLTKQDFMDDMHLLLSGLAKLNASLASSIAQAQ